MTIELTTRTRTLLNRPARKTDQMLQTSDEIVIETGPCRVTPDRIVRLVEITEGQVSGSGGIRWQERRWSVRFDADGTTHGRQFRTLEDASKYFKEQIRSEENNSAITLAVLDEAFEDDWREF